MEEDKTEPFRYIEVSTISDLVRLAASSGLTKPTQIFHFEKENENYYCIFTSLLGLPESRLPACYYCASKKDHKGKYAIMNTDGSPEQIEFTDFVKRGWIAVPIIHLKEPPERTEIP
ncbi:MAG: hypothetical protein ACFFBS_06630 [Promethearchaeota archaeon]